MSQRQGAVYVHWTGEHYEVRRVTGEGRYQVLKRCPHWEDAVVHASEPRAVVRLPASASWRRLGRRFIGRG